MRWERCYRIEMWRSVSVGMLGVGGMKGKGDRYTFIYLRQSSIGYDLLSMGTV